MKYHILTLFPEMIEQGLHTSILGRAINNGYISLETTNIRDFSANKFNRVDDYPYGGGAGMVMEAEPVFRAYQSVAEKIGKKPRWWKSWRLRTILCCSAATMRASMTAYCRKW